VTLLSRISRR